MVGRALGHVRPVFIRVPLRLPGSSGGSLLVRQMDVVLLQNRRPGEAPVENVGIKVRSLRPGYCAQLGIDADLREVGGVAQRREDSLEA